MLCLISAGTLANPSHYVVNTDDWEAFESEASLVAASQYTGVYALVDANSSRIEMYDVHQQLTGSISKSKLLSVIDSDISSQGLGLKGITFTASGRLMYVSVQTRNGLAVVRYNMNTEGLSLFASIEDENLVTGDHLLGLAHHQGRLSVGSGDGFIHTLSAGRNDFTGQLLQSVSVGSEPVTSLTFDRQNDELYAASGDFVYSMNNGTDPIARMNDLAGLTYGRNYGRDGLGGLYLLSNNHDEAVSHLNFIRAEMLHGELPVEVVHYTDVELTANIAATADGKILAAASSPYILSDADDNHLTYNDWLQREYDNYVIFIQSLVSPPYMGEGWVAGSNTIPGTNQVNRAGGGASGWAIIALIGHEALTGDSQEQRVGEIIKRFAGMADDGIIPDTDKDGQFYSNYDYETGRGFAHGGGDNVSVYVTGKIVHGAIRAKEYYSDNAVIVEAANRIIGSQRNYSDYMREYGIVEMSGTAAGPFPRYDLRAAYGYQEVYLFAELASGMDPLSAVAYSKFWRDYEGYNLQKTYLTEETVIKYNISAFVEQYAHYLFKSRRDSEGWRTNFKHLYAHYSAWTDDHSSDTMTVFSAGGTHTSGYSADKIKSHPDTITHFPALLGFGMYGDSAPMVGGYFAYRDGLTQQFINTDDSLGANILARYSNEYPDFMVKRLALPDSIYGFMGVLEHMSMMQEKPSIIDAVIARDSHPSDFKVNLKRSTNATPILGELQSVPLDIINHDFSDKLSGWTQSGDFRFYAPDEESGAIEGNSGEIRSNKEISSEFGRLWQKIDAAEISDMTPFVIRAEGRLLQAKAQDNAYLKIVWYQDNKLLVSQKSNVLNSDAYPSEGATQADIDFSLLTYKPIGATHAILAYEVERNLTLAPRYNRYLIDNITMVQANHLMEEVGDWVVGGGTLDTAEVSQEEITLSLSNGTSNDEYVEVYKDFNIDTSDPVGTRYMINATVDTRVNTDSEFLIYAKIMNTNGVTEMRQEGGDTLRSSENQISLFATHRKLQDTENTYRVVFRFNRKGGMNGADEQAIIRNVVVTKQHR